MRERPILFSSPMVRAILSGQKTQTRRVVKPIGNDEGFVILDYGNGGWPYRSDDGDSTTHTVKRGGKLYHDETPHASPYGQPGDRLYVREAFSYTQGYGKDNVGCPVWYWADGNPKYGDFTRPKPSIHMPRWASRILLEVTGVRVERLNDISKADAIAEGAPPSHPSIDRVSAEYGHADFSRSWYAQLWDQINGPGSWDANPWVWVVEFKRVEGGAA